jgi:hypothetical protein
MNEVADFIKNFAGASQEQHKEINDFLGKRLELIGNHVIYINFIVYKARSKLQVDQGT